jgi:hypothetical protein
MSFEGHGMLCVTTATNQCHDPVVGAEAGSAVIDGFDETGNLEAQYFGIFRGWWIVTLSLNHIGAIDRGCMYAYQ